MSQMMSRRAFVASTTAGGVVWPVGMALGANNVAATSGDAQTTVARSSLPPGFPSLDPATAREIVGRSHTDLDFVTRMVGARPELAKAAWDWGFGDWESALGAASHVGRRDIADVLIAHGARPDIFTLAMFGQLDAVKAIIDANPGIQRAHGPHGITLLAHARAGGDAASAVVAYLQSLGDADHTATDMPLDPALRSALVGRYAYAQGEQPAGSIEKPPSCSIIEQRGSLMFKHEPDGSPRRLVHQGEGRFLPAGAPHVSIVIQSNEMVITDGQVSRRAIRRD